MASFQFALLLFIGLQGCALTIDIDGPDVLTTTGNTCQDCTKVVELLADLFSDAELQKMMVKGIESLCDHLPGKTAILCREEVEMVLPVALKFISGFVKPADICKVIGLCNSCDNRKMLSYFANEALQISVTNENVKPSTQCSFCIFLVKTLDSLLPKERSEEAVIKLLKDICLILPARYRSQCDALIGKFSKTVLDAILSFASPQVVCDIIHMCKEEEGPFVDPCTLSTYRCRDMKTALKCGTLFYCQRFAWKPLNSNTL